MIGIIVFFVLRKNDNGKEEDYTDKYNGLINCIYKLENETNNITLLGNEFKDNFFMDIFIDGEKVKYSKIYNFNSLDEHKVQFGLNNSFSMDYMFKDVHNLKSVEMISNKNLEILSMISSFENCEI